MKKNKDMIYVKFKNGKKTIETYVRETSQVNELFNLTKETIFKDGDDEKEDKDIGFVKNKK